MRRSLGVSVVLHVAALGVLMATGLVTSFAPSPRPIPIQWIKLLQDPHHPKLPDEGDIAYTRKHPHPRPKVVRKPAPVKLAAKPKPKPKPKPIPDDEAKRLAELRKKYPMLARLPDDALKHLPPGITDWSQLASADAAVSTHLDHLGGVPQLGVAAQAQATGSDSVLAAIVGAFRSDDLLMEDRPPTKVNGQNECVGKFNGIVFVARWPDGASQARITYFPVGGQEDPAHTFFVAVDPDYTKILAEAYLLFPQVQAGRPPTMAGSPAASGSAGG